MRGHDSTSSPVESKKPPAPTSMDEIWIKAAKAFEEICGESLQRGDVKGFDDVRKKIEGAGEASISDADPDHEAKWKKAKSAGLLSLQYLKLLVGAASKASSLLPIPGSAATLTSNALCFVFDIPKAIIGYEDAINLVFSQVSSALAQFEIYTSMDHADAAIVRQSLLVMVSFVKICAHVVKFRQGRKRDRLLQRVRSIFDDDSGLGAEMDEFKRVLQQQRDVEGTVTLAVVVETRQDLAVLLEQFVVFGKTTEETNQIVSDTQKGVQALRDDADRIKTLIKIRDTLDVPATVRLDTMTTQTCDNIYTKCLDGTGSWVWTHDAFTAWTAPPTKDKDTPSNILVLSGPPSSGKTSISALITKRLEEVKGRIFVAHYFFPASRNKSDDASMPLALKYMAFQIARVDATVQKALGKACDAGPATFRRLSTQETLDTLWDELRIGVSGSGATYYLVFDGLENLPPKQVDLLLKFVFGPKLSGESAGRVRVMLGGSDDQFDAEIRQNVMESRPPLRIRMPDHNGPDMRLVIDDALAKRGMLQNTKPGSDQDRARAEILDKLPLNVGGSYSRLQFGLDDVIRLLSTRTAFRELDRILDQSSSSHETAIKNLQRSLTADEVGELNELLKWVLFGSEPMLLETLEVAMFLYSGTESLVSLQYIIENKYSAVLKLEDGYVYGKDGVHEYLETTTKVSRAGKPNQTAGASGRPTISMTITINNVDQEVCGHFLWDLAHKAIRDKFKFDLDTTSNAALHGGVGQAVIAVDEFEAHRTIVARAFAYLLHEQLEDEGTNNIGRYFACWLPRHLGRLHQLEFDEDEDNRGLTPNEQSEIGLNLYKIFSDNKVFLLHKDRFESTYWTVSEMEDVQEWLMDSAVVRRVDKSWRKKVQQAVSPTRGVLVEFVKTVIRGLLRERTWGVLSAYYWIEEFMQLEQKKFKQPSNPPREGDDDKPDDHPDSSSEDASASTSDVPPIVYEWKRVSDWCQEFLGLPDSELDSLWYERLAELSDSRGVGDAALELYQRALALPNPSWMCHRGLATMYSGQFRVGDALTEVQLALEKAECEDALPKPAPEDLVELQLLLGEYTYDLRDFARAAGHYLAASKSEDHEQAMRGLLGHFKATLYSPDPETALAYLRDTFLNGEREKSALTIGLVALDHEHDSLVPKIFALTRHDADLLKGVVRAMEAATADASRLAPQVMGTIAGNDVRFPEAMIRAGLLFDRGVAAYRYKVPPEGTEPVTAALRLWSESCEKASSSGGRNAFIVRQSAAALQAQHYFGRSMMDGNHLDHLDALTKIVDSDPSDYNDAKGFLATLHVLHGAKQTARKALVGGVERALQILSDDIPDNDASGYSLLLKSLCQFQDFRSAAIALSLLGQPDLVTEALVLDVKDMPTAEGFSSEQLLTTANNLVEEVLRSITTQFPDSSQQSGRIDAANAHVESLMTLSSGESIADGEPPNPDLTTRHNLSSLLHSRLHPLHEAHVPELNYDQVCVRYVWGCDGRTPDGMRCEESADFGHEFYHCIYCANRDFCSDCLARLRAAPALDDAVDIMACDPKHRWLRIPQQGAASFVGPRAKWVPVPREVRPLDGDEQILEVCYNECGEKKMLVAGWKEALAKEWGLSVGGVRVVEVSPEVNGQADAEIIE